MLSLRPCKPSRFTSLTQPWRMRLVMMCSSAPRSREQTSGLPATPSPQSKHSLWRLWRCPNRSRSPSSVRSQSNPGERRHPPVKALRGDVPIQSSPHPGTPDWMGGVVALFVDQSLTMAHNVARSHAGRGYQYARYASSLSSA